MRSALAVPLPFWWRTGTDHLRAESCDEAQGYLFANARPQADILISQAERQANRWREA
jgi:EAL domain-containing protein (putative c-di-GMP-specific phosphodiesterase class I)